MSDPELAKARRTGITAITIENFKGVGSMVTIPIRPITLFFGANSAGKSTIIQAIHYARELIDRNNPDADIPLAGGNAIDLGGFRSMVHKHDLERAIKIGFELTPDDDGLKGLDDLMGIDVDMGSGAWAYQWNRRLHERYFEPIAKLHEQDPSSSRPETKAAILRLFESLGKSAALSPPSRADVNPFTKTVNVCLTVKWDPGSTQPYIALISYGLNGRPLLSIALDSPVAVPRLRLLDGEHPILKEFWPDLPEEEQTPGSPILEFFRTRGESGAGIPLKGMKHVVTAKTQVLPLSIEYDASEEDDVADEFWVGALLNQIVLGTNELLRSQLSDFRYIGPIRTKPESKTKPAAIITEGDWADGSAAWDWLLRCHRLQEPGFEKVLENVNSWIKDEDKLDLGFTLELSRVKRVRDTDEILRHLQRISSQYDELDADYFKKQIWEPLQKLPTEQSIELVDQRTGTRVGLMDVGSGITQVIPIIAASLDPKSKILAFEQPELHLHPAAQARLGDLFVTATREGGRMFLLETHSELLILRLLRRIRQTTDGESPSKQLELHPADLGVIHVEQSVNGTIITQLDVDDSGEFLRQWPGRDGFFEERAKELFE